MNVKELMVDDIVLYSNGDQQCRVTVRKIDGVSDVVCVEQENGHRFNTVANFIKPAPIPPDIMGELILPEIREIKFVHEYRHLIMLAKDPLS